VLPDVSGKEHILPDLAVNRQSDEPLQALKDFQTTFEFFRQMRKRLIIAAERQQNTQQAAEDIVDGDEADGVRTGGFGSTGK